MNDNSLNKRAMKSGIFFVVCQMLVRGISFISTPIYTRLMSTEQIGIVKIYDSWLQIAVPFMSLCLWKSVERAKYDMRQEFDSYTSATQNLSYISIALMGALCLLFKGPLEKILNMDDTMLLVGIGYVFAYTSVHYMNRREKQKMKYKFATVATMLMVIPAVVISCIWLYIGNVRGETERLVHYRIIGFYVPHIVAGLIIAFILAFQGKVLFSKKYWKYGLLYSLPLIPEVVSIQIMNQADKIMVSDMVSEWASGIFAVATNVSFVIWILEDSVWNAFLPWFYEKISRGETEDIPRPLSVIMRMFGMLSWLLVIFAPEIIWILGGSKNMAAIWLVAPMVTSTLFRFYSYNYTAVQNYYKKTAYVASGTVIAMFVNVGLNYVCILLFGYQAAAYTTAASYIFLLILQGWQEMRITGQRIIPLKTTLKYAFVFLAANLITMGSYLLPWYLRYLVALTGILYASYKILPEFMGILKSVRQKH